jgi:hypothetical protein
MEPHELGGDLLMVGKVPLVNNPEVRPNSPPAKYISDRNATAETFGAGIGRAQSALGANLERLGGVLVDHGIRVKEEQNAAEATDLYLKADIALAEKRNVFSSLEGKNAVDALPQYLKDVQQLGDEYAKGASNDKVRQRFAQNFARQQGFAVTEGGRYAAGQRKRYESGLTLSLRQSAEQEAVAYADDDVRFLNAADLTDQSVKQQAMQEGWSEEQTNLELRKSRSNIWEKRLAVLSIKEPIRANEIYQGAKDQIDGISRVRIEQHINAGLVNQGARKIADSVVSKPVELPQQDRAPDNMDTYLARTAQVESGGNPTTPGGGMYQFKGATAKKYGVTDASTVAEQTEAARRLATDNVVSLQTSLGRDPSQSELYLAHQQGAAGASALLRNPDVPAIDALAPLYPSRAVAMAAITGNGGSPNMTAGEFARLQQSRFDGAQANARGVPSAAQDEYVQQRMMAEARARAEAISPGNQQLSDAAAQRTAAQYDEQIKGPRVERERLQREAERAEKARVEALDNAMFTELYKGKLTPDAVMRQDIPRPLKEHYLTLIEKANKETDSDAHKYGPAFSTVFSLINRPSDDPNRLADERKVDAMLGNGLTMEGVKAARAEIQGKKTLEGSAESEMKSAFTKSMRQAISGENELLRIKDPKGDQLYADFLTYFLPKYADSRRSGKTPAELFNSQSPEYLGKILPQFQRPPAVYMRDLIEANPFEALPGPAASGTPAPVGPSATAKIAPAKAYTSPAEVKADLDAQRLNYDEAAQILRSRGWAQ